MIENVQERITQTKVTEDGSIVKLLLQTGISDQPKWTKGAKATLHYKSYTFAPKPKPNAQTTTPTKIVSPNKHHNHTHSKDCSHSEKSNPASLNLGKEEKNGVEGKKIIDEEKYDYTKKPEKIKIGDSKESDPDLPFELRIGLKFSVPALETCVKTMKVGEKARFLILPERLDGYISLETSLREEKINRDLVKKGLPRRPKAHGNCCASQMAAMESGENQDLQNILQSPLELEIHLLDLQQSGQFQKEAWEMTNEERIIEAPKKRLEGIELYKKSSFSQARDAFARSLMLLESVSVTTEMMDEQRERKKKIEKLAEAQRRRRQENIKRRIDGKEDMLPEIEFLNDGSLHDKAEMMDSDEIYFVMQSCRLNYAACLLKLKDYTSVIKQCTEVIAKIDSYIPPSMSVSISIDEEKRVANETIKREKEFMNFKVKALFRRAQAVRMVGVDLEISKLDLDKCENLLKDRIEFLKKRKIDDDDIKQLGEVLCEVEREKKILFEREKAYTAKQRQQFSRIFE